MYLFLVLNFFYINLVRLGTIFYELQSVLYLCLDRQKILFLFSYEILQNISLLHKNQNTVIQHTSRAFALNVILNSLYRYSNKRNQIQLFTLNPGYKINVGLILNENVRLKLCRFKRGVSYVCFLVITYIMFFNMVLTHINVSRTILFKQFIRLNRLPLRN